MIGMLWIRGGIAMAVMTVAGAVGPSALIGQEVPAARPQPLIEVTGSGEARITPDRATIFMGVQSRASTAAQAAAENARRQRAVLDTLRATGLTPEQVSTTGYSVSPEMQYPPAGGSPKLIGYTVSNTVRVDAKKLEDVSKYIDAALAKGANQMSGLQFFSSKADSARRSALAEAVANAHADAEAIARAAGGSLGQLLYISTEYSGGPRPVQLPMARMTAAVAPTPIEPGEQSVYATVTARWAFVAIR